MSCKSKISQLPACLVRTWMKGMGCSSATSRRQYPLPGISVVPPHCVHLSADHTGQLGPFHRDAALDLVPPLPCRAYRMYSDHAGSSELSFLMTFILSKAAGPKKRMPRTPSLS